MRPPAPIRATHSRAWAGYGACSSHTSAADWSSQGAALGSRQTVVLEHSLLAAHRQVVAGALQPVSAAHVYTKSFWHTLLSTCLPTMHRPSFGGSIAPPTVR